MKRKGFTLIELLVVIAIIALLMSILMPALARVREIAQRVVCGTNLSGIGKAMAVYANDDDSSRFPRATEFLDSQGLIVNDPRGTWGPPDPDFTISQSFYLLVKLDYTTPKQFVCKSDSGTTPLELGDFADPKPLDFTDVMALDFGDNPAEHCSFAYHLPYHYNHVDGALVCFGLTSVSNPGMAVAADRSPYMESPSATPETDPSADPKIGNANAHQKEGQNVLFVDFHVKFERKPDCGVNDDNIYTQGIKELSDSITNRTIGIVPVRGPDAGPVGTKDEGDSVLVND